MSNNKIFKNNQVNVGMPFPIKTPVTYQPPARIVNFRAADFTSEDVEKGDGIEKADYNVIKNEIVNKAKIEADMIIKEALLEAKDIITKATLEVEELKLQVMESAREEGYNNGILQAEEEYQNLLAEAQDIRLQAGVEYKQVLDSIEEDAVNTILSIAKKVISSELKCKENILLLVKDAFDKCSKDHNAVLRLNEKDYDLVNENIDELMTMVERAENIEIKKDLSLKEGGCIIETPYGSIDASAKTKLDKIEEDFTSVLNETIN